MNSINQIVNFDSHPFNLSADYLNACKNELKNNSVLQLDNFLLPKSLKKIQNEANFLHSKAYYCSQNHTVMLNMKNNDLETPKIFIIDEINSLGVPCSSGSCPEVYLERAFDATDFRPISRLKNSKELGETSLMFLVHPTLKDDEIQKTCDTIRSVMKLAS